MSVLWTILSIVLTVLAIGWGLLRLVMKFNQLLMSGRAVMTAIMVFLVLGIIAFIATSGYVVMEFVVNKGPDDWGSMWHAGYPLSAKYGKFQSSSYTMNTFEKDTNGSGSGTYRVHFEYNGHAGVVLCHYDKSTGKFDRDEIVSDK